MVDIAKPDYTYIWSSGGAIVAPSNVKIQTGWTAEVPPFQWENWSQNRQDQAIAHVLQHGISVWDDATEYQAGKSYVQGSDGLLYKARTTHTNVNPVTDVSFTSWTKALSGGLLNTRVITVTGTYTPTPGTTYIVVDVVVTVGAGGAGGAAGANTGQPGTQSSFGAFCSATGGGGGQGGAGASTAASSMAAGGAGGAGVGGNILAVSGSRGSNAVSVGVDIGRGGGGAGGLGYRSGADGVQSCVSTPAAAGAVGTAGIVIIREYM